MKWVTRISITAFLAIWLSLVVVAFANAEDVVSVDIPINTILRGDPGELFLVATVETGPGLECQGGVDPNNNKSEHPNSDIVFVSGETGGTIFNVEVSTFVGQDIFFVSEGPTLIYVRIGDDGVFSAGFIAMLDCHEHEEPTTTTTTLPPEEPPSVTTTTTTQPPTGSTTTTTEPAPINGIDTGGGAMSSVISPAVILADGNGWLIGGLFLLALGLILTIGYIIWDKKQR